MFNLKSTQLWTAVDAGFIGAILSVFTFQIALQIVSPDAAFASSFVIILIALLVMFVEPITMKMVRIIDKQVESSYALVEQSAKTAKVKKQLQAIVTGDLNFKPDINFLEFENGAVEVTFKRCREDQWHVQNSTTIQIIRDTTEGLNIVATIELPELPCFNDSIRYERYDRGDFSVLYVPIKSIEKPVKSFEIFLDSHLEPEHIKD